MTKKLLSRKDLARMMDVSPRMIRDNEKSLGISDFKVKINSRIVLYQAWKVLPLLKQRGLISGL